MFKCDYSFAKLTLLLMIDSFVRWSGMIMSFPNTYASSINCRGKVVQPVRAHFRKIEDGGLKYYGDANFHFAY